MSDLATSPEHPGRFVRKCSCAASFKDREGRGCGLGTSYLCEQGGTQLAGNHFLRVVEGKENLRALGEVCLWEGAQDILFEHA